MTVNRVCAALLMISMISMCAFLYLFVSHNAPGLHSLYVTAAIAVGYGAVFLHSSLRLARSLWIKQAKPPNRNSARIAQILFGLMALLLIWVFLDATVTDYYQPISLFDDVILALGLSWGLLVILFLVLLLRATRVPLNCLRYALLLGVIAILGWPVMASLAYVNEASPSEAVTLHRDVFVGGQDGYDVYRIPGLLVLPQDSTLADGSALKNDRVLAFAEARRDGALDTGAIDLVMKYSDDGGENWSAQQLVCRNENKDKRGKCGNATPLFDSHSGTVLLPYNLSGLASESSRHHSSVLVSSPDGGMTWSNPRVLAEDNLVFGPGHGIQKSLPPFNGRLLIPGYLGQSAIVLFSDDHGETWQRSAALDTGNETELAELSDGQLYLATRHNAPIARPPEPNGRLYSRSVDGGSSWSPTAVDTSLSTPVCQASVIRFNLQGGLLFANPNHHKARVNMAIRYSPDDGENWTHEVVVYPGPAGYSVLGVASDESVLLLYERGTMSYSEKISFASISGGLFTK